MIEVTGLAFRCDCGTVGALGKDFKLRALLEDDESPITEWDHGAQAYVVLGQQVKLIAVCAKCGTQAELENVPMEQGVILSESQSRASR